MTDERPRGSCVIPGCPRDPYPDDAGHQPLACGPHVSAMRHWLVEIPGLVAELSGGGYVMRDTVGDRLELLIEDGDARRFRPVARYGPAPARLVREQPDHPLVVRAGLPVEHRDLVANVLPAGPMPGAARGGRVSGSAEPRLPINEDRTDLLAPARTSTAASAPLAYPEQDGDQVGFLPVAATLDGLAEGLRLHRLARGERRPFPAVTSLCTWLLERLDDACDDWPGVGELFDEVRRAYGALRGQLGRIDVPDYKAGVPCPHCYAQRLVQEAGEILIRCLACPAVLLESEYHEHVATLARKVTRVKVKATLSIDGGEERPCNLQITTHMVDVSSLGGTTKPDMAWTYVDGAGHFHAWAHDSSCPTLEERRVWVPYEEPDEEGETGYNDITSHCRICAEEVYPATVMTHEPGRQMAPGRTEWKLTFTGDAPERFSAVVRTEGRTYFGVAESAYDRGEPHPGGPGLAYGISMSWRKERAA